MEKVIEVGKYYELKRLFGRIVRGKLIQWNGKDQRLIIEELNNKGILALDKLEEQEYQSMKEINPE